MSRVIVKGLPRYYTEEKLNTLFSEEGVVTDVKLIRKTNGESRRFAFVGFKTMQDAEAAVKHRNGTFVDTAKIMVEMAHTQRDPERPLSWREKNVEKQKQLEQMEEKLERMEKLDKSARLRIKLDREHRQNRKDLLSEKIEQNPDLQEFLGVMKTSTEGPSWANDAVVSGKKMSADQESKAKAVEPTGSDDEYEDLNDGQKKAEPEEKMMTLDEHEKAEEEEKQEIQESEKKQDEDTADMDDLEWFKNRRVRIPEKTEEPVPESKEERVETEEPKKHEKRQEVTAEPEPEVTDHDRDVQQIMESRRLFLRNLPYSATESDFRQLFSHYGEMEEIHVAVDTRTGKSKGFAYVQFKSADLAVKAFDDFEGSIFQGRLLHILPAKIKKEKKLDEFVLKNMPLKKQRFLKRKYGAAKQQFSWNSLYMNNDAVLESVAASMGITKSELISPESSSSAVKQALAEAHVIGDVRKYFEGKGVDLTSFSKNEKDDRIILVKNFQHGTTKEEIGEAFAQYGQLKRILMPPAGTIAIVEFRDAQAGRSAFTRLAFKRLGKSILYLEKGPKDLFTEEPAADDAVGETEEDTGKKSAGELLAQDKDEEDDSSSDDDEGAVSGPTVSVFVKNLNFTTTAADLTNLFKTLDGFVVAVVKTKPDTKHPGQTLSMGFGFVEFHTRSQAMSAIRIMDGYMLNQHKLELKLSTREGGSSANDKKRKRSRKSPKVIVKNLPFEATRKDVLELFNSFGNLRSVRVPKKFDKSARGFAFVEFNTAKEAESAMDQLQGVHLLGRRLVLDYAEKDAENVEEEIERMTKRARKQAGAREMASIRERNSEKTRSIVEDGEED